EPVCLRRSAGRRRDGVHDRVDPRPARSSDGRYDGTWRHDRSGLSHGTDRRLGPTLMYLTFEVISANAAVLGEARRAVFTVDGGRIGRAAENDMVLPGAGVHRHHATVRFINGVFFIEGVGANGIAVNNPDVVLPRNEPYPLKNGDRVYIDEFEVAVATSA